MNNMATLQLLFCLYLTIQLHYLAQGCINTSESIDTPYLTLSENLRHQAIIPSYRLNCTGMCGNITNWKIAAFDPDRRRRRETKNRDSRDIQPATSDSLLGLQVWRPLPPINESTGTGCYGLVGSQGISFIPDEEDRFILTPSPSGRCDIPFQPGDVLGFFVNTPSENFDSDGVRIRGAPGINTVWYAEDNPIASSMQTVYLIGNDPPGDLDYSSSVAPAISIAIETYPCPTSFSTLSISTSTPVTASLTTISDISIAPSITLSSIFAMTTASQFTTTQAPSPTSEPLPTPSNTVTVISDGDQTPPLPMVNVTDTTDPIDINDIDDTLTTGSLLPIEVSDNSNNLGELVAGAIVAILAVLVLATLLIITIIFIFKQRRLGKRTDTLGIVHTRIGFSNQNYERLDNEFETSYESVDASSEPIVPVPRIRYSPASETITTELPPVSESNPVIINRSDIYHVIGPSISNLPSIASNGTDTLRSDHTYQYIEAGTIGEESNTIYKNPSQPNYGGVKYSEVSSTDVFDSAGVYVPTWDERSTWEGHYDMQDIKVYNRLKFFEEEKAYWAPASTTTDLYSQLASKKYREIPRNQVRILNQLGSGQFGEVCKAVWSLSGTTKELAIKTLRAELPEEEKVRFLQEAAIMGQFSHPNIVKLYGVVTVGDPMMICLELMTNGDLRCHLCSLNPHTCNSKELEVQFLQFSKQIASGMEYLASKSFIHRDLAARNILLDQTLACKIGDFGMARDLMNETYYTAQSKGAKIPIKWTAPEALFYRKYSTNSDVWSYGMVLFEIWSVGKKPFSQFSNSDVLRQINTGYNQPPPPGCPRAIYQLMVDCWHPVHSQRPPFSEISHYLGMSSDTLLEWREEDNLGVNSRARELGAPLTEAVDLYKDLQDVYLQFEDL